MARKKDYGERLELINKVGSYFIESGDSTRGIAKKFNIGNSTVSSYIEKYIELNPSLKEAYYKQKDLNTPKGISNLEVRKRVIDVLKSVLEQKTIRSISNEIDIKLQTVYNDVHIRMNPLLDSLSEEELLEYFKTNDKNEIKERINSQLKSNSSNSRRTKWDTNYTI